MAEPVEETIRRRVVALLDARPDVTDEEFGRRIGRGYSWVSAFRNGTRHANDIHLLIKIARFFHVSVGYLLGEIERAPDPGAATLVATYEQADERDRRLLLSIVAPFRAGATESSTAEPRGAEPSEGAHTPPKPPAPQTRKRRKE